MKTIANRLYGSDDVRLEVFNLPELKDNEILLEVISDTLCASTYKAVKLGVNHKRVPPDIDKNPIIIGHEMCGIVRKVGKYAKGNFKVGDKAVVQPALKLESGYDPGYSYKYIGGAATFVIVPDIVLERNCLIHYNGDSFFAGSLTESLACIIRGYKGCYHTDYTTYIRTDGAKRNGKVAILGGAGPMGIGAIELAIGYAGVKQVVVTDLDEKRLEYANKICSVEEAKRRGVDLIYLNTSNIENPVEELKRISSGGFDDVFVMVAVSALFTMAEEILKEDGCLNMFAGSADHFLKGSLNLYRIHYDGIHVVGTAGSIPKDMEEIIELIENKKINAGALISHILGIRAYKDAIYGLGEPNGTKKVCYTGLDIPLIALDDLENLGKTNPLYKKLDELVKKNGGIWNSEAEEYLLNNAPRIEY